MVRFVALIALAGCGRFGFDVVPNRTDDGGSGIADSAIDVVPLGHDEDGDGIPDVTDVCPHLTGTQTDGDGDGVGDDCDPNPVIGGDAILVFATMGPGDQPFSIGALTDGVVTQLADALLFDGDLATGGDNNLFGSLTMPIVLADARVAIGFDLLAIIPGSDSNQNQIAMAVYDQPPNYFVELNQIPGIFDNAQVTHFDGSTFVQSNSANLATGMHAGALFFQTTQRVGQGVRLDVAWPGEPYVAEVMDAEYQGAVRIELNFNNVHFEIDWLVVISSP